MISEQIETQANRRSIRSADNLQIPDQISIDKVVF
jgi:hypothetical protein